MSRFALLSALLSFLLLAAGCSGGLHSDAQPMQIYVLRAAESVSAAKANGSAVTPTLDPAASANAAAPAPSVQLPRPSADPGLATELITLVRSDHRMDYYAGSRWASQLPDVVSALALDTLRASGQWGSVQESPSAVSSDYLLQIKIRRFEADYTDGDVAPKVYVAFDCTLARRIGRELVTTFAAEASAEASENRLSAVVSAFEKAANAALAVMAERSVAAAKATAAPP
jgi:cholesterol transport system auxiliary component